MLDDKIGRMQSRGDVITVEQFEQAVDELQGTVWRVDYRPRSNPGESWTALLRWWIIFSQMIWTSMKGQRKTLIVLHGRQE